ncbi:16856_t:CDS:1, partial [Gigaspora rosea]
KIVPEIHYGPFSREWWTAIGKDPDHQTTILLPIRIGMKTLVELNGYEFFISVLEPDMEYSLSPRYQASCGLAYSEIHLTSSAAITSLHQHLFNTKTKFSGPFVIGFDQLDIVEQLLEDINFQPFEFYLDQLRIVVFGIGLSKNQDWNYVGNKYKSSF